MKIKKPSKCLLENYRRFYYWTTLASIIMVINLGISGNGFAQAMSDLDTRVVGNSVTHDITAEGKDRLTVEILYEIETSQSANGNPYVTKDMFPQILSVGGLPSADNNVPDNCEIGDTWSTVTPNGDVIVVYTLKCVIVSNSSDAQPASLKPGATVKIAVRHGQSPDALITHEIAHVISANSGM